MSSDMQKRKDDSSAHGASAKRHKADRPGAQQRKAKPGKTPEEKAERDRKFVELARTHHRCFKCGNLVKPEEREVHRSTCSRDKGAFLRRMGMVAAKVAWGEDPNAFEPRRELGTGCLARVCDIARDHRSRRVIHGDVVECVGIRSNIQDPSTRFKTLRYSRRIIDASSAATSSSPRSGRRSRARVRGTRAP